MSRLVTFTPRPRGDRTPPDKSAEIVIFTGVRYERTGRVEPETRNDNSGKRRRKRG